MGELVGGEGLLLIALGSVWFPAIYRTLPNPQSL
jgi:hypothetical protein